MEDEPWLSDVEQRLWRRWVGVSAKLPAAQHRQLQADSGLSLPDFVVLVLLTESDQGRVRVSDLARGLEWERSRVSHHVSRMQRRGLVRKDECPDDARGAFVVVTAQGRAAIEAAAPGHAREVRRLVFDQLSASDVEVISDALARIEQVLDAGRRD